MKKKVLLALALSVAIGLGAYWYAKANDEPTDAVASSTTPTLAKDEPAAPVVPALRGADRSPSRSVAWTLESSDDYSMLLAQQLPLAEGGDATAMSTVAKVLEYCQLYSESPAGFESHIQFMASLKPSEGQALKRVAAKISKRCSKVAASPTVPEAAQSWLLRAAEAGDVSALIRTAILHYEGTSPQERAALISAALNSGDPNVVFEAAGLLPFGVDSDSANLPLTDSEIDRMAWEVAACRLGAACDAGQNLMDAHCVAGSGCNAVGYEDLVRREFLPQGSWSLLDKKVREIIQYVEEN
jgi:hypothetical protein